MLKSENTLVRYSPIHKSATTTMQWWGDNKMYWDYCIWWQKYKNLAKYLLKPKTQESYRHLKNVYRVLFCLILVLCWARMSKQGTKYKRCMGSQSNTTLPQSLDFLLTSAEVVAIFNNEKWHKNIKWLTFLYLVQWSARVK